MKNSNKWIRVLIIIFIFGGIIVLSNQIANSFKSDNMSDSFSIKIDKDEHVVPFEKVYVVIDGKKDKIVNVSLLVGNDKASFKVDLVDLQTDSPSFELPYYSNNVIAGLKYYIKEAIIKYEDGRVVRYTTSKNDKMYLSISERDSYFVVDEINDDVDAWRDFKGVDFSDYSYVNNNIYFKIYGDTTEMVDIQMNFVRIDEKKNFIADVEGFGNRIFFDISDTNVVAGEEYYLKDMTIYYSNGGSYNYTADNYANILNNRIFITNVIEDSLLKASEPETDDNQPNAIKSAKRERNVAGGIVILFLILIGAFGIFFYLKDED